jgi:hypothetical protein
LETESRSLGTVTTFAFRTDSRGEREEATALKKKKKKKKKVKLHFATGAEEADGTAANPTLLFFFLL